MLDDEFLDEALDPAQLTIAKLKAALGQVDVELPMRQEKKAFYVDLYRRHIVQRLPLLLKQKQAVQPSSAGIVAVSSRGSPLADKSAPAAANPFQSAATPEPVRRARKHAGRSPTPRRAVTPTPRPKVDFTQFINRDAFPIAGYVTAQQVAQMKAGGAKSSGRASLLTVLKQFTAALALSVLLLLAIQFQRFQMVPYCDTSANGTINDHMAVNYRLGVPYPLPKCRPCPPHAMCTSGVISCPPGFIKHSSWWFLSADKCVADVEKYVKAEQLLNEVSRLLSDHVGSVECGEVVADAFIKEADLRDTIRSSHLTWDKSRFSSYWNLMMEEVKKDSGKHRLTLRIRGDSYQLSSLDPSYPLMCRITKTLQTFLTANRNEIFGTLAVIMATFGMYWTYQSRRENAKRIRELVSGVLAVLVDQDERFKRGEDVGSALSTSQLRDYFLLDKVESAVERSQIWAQVRSELLHNSSVRETAILIEGEQHDAWQWIGSSPLLSPGRRSSPAMQQKRPVANVADASTPVKTHSNSHFTSPTRINGQHSGSSMYPNLD